LKSFDVIFREDAAGLNRDHTPENLNVLRKTALSLLGMAPTPRPGGKKKITGPKRRFIASMNPGYMLAILFGK
jgi:hypothetical protein